LEVLDVIDGSSDVFDVPRPAEFVENHPDEGGRPHREEANVTLVVRSWVYSGVQPVSLTADFDHRLVKLNMFGD
jgi:hypothetical protein